jgi:hypothetical protein
MEQRRHGRQRNAALWSQSAAIMAQNVKQLAHRVQRRLAKLLFRWPAPECLAAA